MVSWYMCVRVCVVCCVSQSLEKVCLQVSSLSLTLHEMFLLFGEIGLLTIQVAPLRICQDELGIFLHIYQVFVDYKVFCSFPSKES